MNKFCCVAAALWIGAPLTAYAESFDFAGYATAGDELVVAGSFAGHDANGDSTVDSTEITFFEAYLFEPATGAQRTFLRTDLTAFSFSPSQLLLSFDVSVGVAGLTVSNAGDPLSHAFAAFLGASSSGPIALTPQYPGTGVHAHVITQLGAGGTPLDNNTVLGSFTLDGVRDIADLATAPAAVTDANLVVVARDGTQTGTDFDFGNSTPDGSGSSGVEVHYQCGSPDIYCWGSVEDFIGLWSDAGSGSPAPAGALASFAVMEGTAKMQNVPVSAAYLIRRDFVGTPADTDADGIPDTADNCTNQANPGQQDTDADNIGNACDPDIAPAVNDCLVNFADLLVMQLAFFSMPGQPGWNPDADLNSDNVVNFADLGLTVPLFFGPPGPSASGCN